MVLKVIQESLGPWSSHGDAIARVLESRGIGLSSLEASGRSEGSRWNGGRMMLEYLDADTALGVLGKLPVDIAPAVKLAKLAGNVPLIAGWDTGRTPPAAKVYLNLSDASRTVREDMTVQLGLPRLAPHVIGLNLTASGQERKLYFQSRELPESTPPVLREWARAVSIAGAVRSLDVHEDGSLHTRAVFIAPTSDAPYDDALATIPGWDKAAFDAAVPFEWQQIRSIGCSPDGGSWVVYVKPRRSGAPLESLEPVVCVRCPGGELGIFAVPGRPELRAYAHTASHGVSYRIREGNPEQAIIHRVMEWAIESIKRYERTGTLRWVSPPGGCRVVGR